MRILGIDYGTKRIGLALSDETKTLAREWKIVSPKDFWAQLPRYINDQQVEKIVIGLPLSMSGEYSKKTNEVEEFAKQLTNRISLPVELVDERLSSVMAEGIAGNKEQIDSLAAQIFLQNYLNHNQSNI